LGPLLPRQGPVGAGWRIRTPDLLITTRHTTCARGVGLERRTARGGRESIDHPPGAHDDLSNAAAGALVIASQKKALSFGRRTPQVHLGYSSAKRRQDAYQYRKVTDVSIKHEIEDMANAETKRIPVGETGVWIQPHEVRGERTKFGIFDSKGNLCGYVWDEAAAKAAAAQLGETGQITR